jgi:alpha-tubulin suppressor-like RCC1 family protein
MSMRFKGGVIFATPPTIAPPVDGEGGSASGVWTLQTQLQNAAVWPKPLIPRELYSWGLNTNGQLGLGNVADRSSPVQVGNLATWETVTAGSSVSVAIKRDGTMWSWGSNGAGQLGQNSDYGAKRSSPVQIGALTAWAKVAAGGYDTFNNHCFAIKTNGTLWAWGDNGQGRLGINDTDPRSSPVQVGALSDWVQIAAGQFASLAVRSNGTLWSWGRNYEGILGQNNAFDLSSPKQVGALTTWSKVAMSRSAVAIKTDGTLWMWGRDASGQLGLSTQFNNRSSPVQVGALTNWANATSSSTCTFAIKTDGTLWAWGYNAQGRLGLNNQANRSSPVQVGALTTWSKVSAGARFASPFGGVTLAVKTDGTLWSWGSNQFGQAGLGDTTARSSPVQVGADTNWANIAMGNATALATTKG